MKLLLCAALTITIAAAAGPQTAWDAKVLGVQIGTSHMGLLVRHLGRAFVTVGTHPQSGRGWELSKGLQIWADGSYSDGKDEILDNLSLTGWHGKLRDALNGRGRKLSFGPFGCLELRMSQSQVAGALNSVLGEPVAQKTELKWNVRGPRGWPTKVIATFPKGHLEGVFVTADVDIHQHRVEAEDVHVNGAHINSKG